MLKLLLKIQLLEILLGFRALNFSNLWIFFSFYESLSGSEFVFTSFGILSLFKLMLEILLGFRVRIF